MATTRKRPLSGIDLLQWAALVLLTIAIYRYFGPAPTHHARGFSTLATLAAGLFLFIWPAAFKERS